MMLSRPYTGTFRNWIITKSTLWCHFGNITIKKAISLGGSPPNTITKAVQEKDRIERCFVLRLT